MPRAHVRMHTEKDFASIGNQLRAKTLLSGPQWLSPGQDRAAYGKIELSNTDAGEDWRGKLNVANERALSTLTRLNHRLRIEQGQNLMTRMASNTACPTQQLRQQIGFFSGAATHQFCS
jgi:hypothetical protein